MDEDFSAVAPCRPQRAAELKQVAKSIVRIWLAGPDRAPLDQRIDAIGAAAVRESAELTRRFGAAAAPGAGEQVLADLRALVEKVHAPPRRLFGRPPALETRLEAAEPELGRLIEALGREADRSARAVIERRGLLDELRRCDEALEEAVHQCRALEAATASAARELGPSDPVRANRLREAAEVRLTERERDLLTQLIVVRQGRMSIGAVLDSEAALGRALERTRHTMVAALRTAAAARRAAAATRRYGGERASGREPGPTELEGAVAAMRAALRSPGAD
jgi:hypothetical protein